jgi:hypothetical protein
MISSFHSRTLSRNNFTRDASGLHHCSLPHCIQVGNGSKADILPLRNAAVIQARSCDSAARGACWDRRRRRMSWGRSFLWSFPAHIRIRPISARAGTSRSCAARLGLSPIRPICPGNAGRTWGDAHHLAHRRCACAAARRAGLLVGGGRADFDEKSGGIGGECPLRPCRIASSRQSANGQNRSLLSGRPTRGR